MGYIDNRRLKRLMELRNLYTHLRTELRIQVG